MATIRIALQEVVGYFDELEDPRSTINQKHPFVSVVVIALMAVLAGASWPTTMTKMGVSLLRIGRRHCSTEQPAGIARGRLFFCTPPQ